MNNYDSDRIMGLLVKEGWDMVRKPEDADLLIVNTCTVRELAEEKAFSLLGRWEKLKKSNPDLIIGMTGCLAQHLQTRAFQRAAGIDFLAGPRALMKIPDLIKETSSKCRASDFEVHFFGKGNVLGLAPETSHPISSLLAVMEGCEQYCAYCAVPMARGRETSRDPDDIVSEAAAHIKAGSREIVLLGQNICRYGLDRGETEGLTRLLHRVAELPGLLRLRFLTSHPASITDSLMMAMRELPTLCEAFHLPLQSGSNAILKSMNRGYTAEHYIELCCRLRDAVPEISLTTDIIVGFPGESDQDFSATLDLVDKIKFDAAYCFKFSPRSGTKAADLEGQIPKRIKEERLDVLLNVVEKHALERKRRFLNTTQTVLVERTDPKGPGRLKGRTRANHPVYFDGSEEYIGQEFGVTITGVTAWALSGDMKGDDRHAG